MRSLPSFLVLACASASCFPSFDKSSTGGGGSGATGSSSSGTMVNATVGSVSATSTSSTGTGGSGGAGPVPCNLADLNAIQLGSFALNDNVQITGLVAAGGNVFVAGHSSSGFDGNAATAGTFLFWGQEGGSILDGVHLDPETPRPPQVALAVSQRNGTSYLEIARGTPGHVSLYEIDAAAFAPEKMSVSAIGAECSGLTQSVTNPSIATAEDGSVVLAIERAPNLDTGFQCEYGYTYKENTPTAVGAFTVLLAVHGSFPTPYMEVATMGGLQIEPRLAMKWGPGAMLPLVLTTQTGPDVLTLQHAFGTFDWGLMQLQTSEGSAAQGTTLRPAALEARGFVGGTVQGANWKAFAHAADLGGPVLLDSSGSPGDARSVRDLHGGGKRVAVGGMTTSMAASSGLAIGGDPVNRLVCPSSSQCSYAVSFDPAPTPPVIGKQAFIEPLTPDVPVLGAVFSDSCGQLYAAGTFKAQATISVASPPTGSSNISPIGQQSLFLFKVGN